VFAIPPGISDPLIESWWADPALIEPWNTGAPGWTNDPRDTRTAPPRQPATGRIRSTKHGDLIQNLDITDGQVYITHQDVTVRNVTVKAPATTTSSAFYAIDCRRSLGCFRPRLEYVTIDGNFCLQEKSFGQVMIKGFYSAGSGPLLRSVASTRAGDGIFLSEDWGPVTEARPLHWTAPRFRSDVNPLGVRAALEGVWVDGLSRVGVDPHSDAFQLDLGSHILARKFKLMGYAAKPDFEPNAQPNYDSYVNAAAMLSIRMSGTLDPHISHVLMEDGIAGGGGYAIRMDNDPDNFWDCAFRNIRYDRGNRFAPFLPYGPNLSRGGPHIVENQTWLDSGPLWNRVNPITVVGGDPI
jgi:hypothetical protein